MGKYCCLLFVLIVATAVLTVSIGVPLVAKKVKERVYDVQQGGVDDVCLVTSYPATCNQTLAGGNFTADSREVTRASLQSANTGVNTTWGKVLFLVGTNPDVTNAVDVCAETLGLSHERIEAALMELQLFNVTTREEAMSNVKAWVSAAMELHSTCVDAVRELIIEVGSLLEQQASHTNQLFSNSLAFINAMARYGDDLSTWKNSAVSFLGDVSNLGDVHIPTISGFGNRRLLASVVSADWMSVSGDGSVPAWMDDQTKGHLLHANTSYDVVVAQDGSGNYDTIQAAVDAHQENTARLVIRVKAGTYNEQVNVPKECKFLTIVGDGDATIITGDKNVALMPGMNTFSTATLMVSGDGFIGKSFLVRNTAGAEGHQAVAFRGTADQIALYQVTFDGYQDTLYAHTGRQYYRDCTIRGTVDFIFGNAAASFQACSVVTKQTTLIGQQNTYSAQGREDPHQSTGLAFQNCVFDGTPELKANTSLYPTYLGRPWKAYSVCVLLKSELMGHIHPEGWLEWNTSSFGLYTSYFAEYQNFGAGSNTAQRANWSHQITSASVANKYIANNFVDVSSWMIGYDIPLTDTL